jgi:hypothetical protein
LFFYHEISKPLKLNILRRSKLTSKTLTPDTRKMRLKDVRPTIDAIYNEHQQQMEIGFPFANLYPMDIRNDPSVVSESGISTQSRASLLTNKEIWLIKQD